MDERESNNREKDIRWRIAAARRMLHREGCDSNVGGHVSARAEDRDGAFWVTGFEYFDTTTPGRIRHIRCKQFEGIPEAEVRKMLVINAARLYRLPSDELDRDSR